MSRTWAGAVLLLGIFVVLVEGAAPPPKETPERVKMRVEADKLSGRGRQLFQQGKALEAAKALESALKLQEKLYPNAQFPEGHLLQATTLNDLGIVLEELGEPAKALPYFEQALAMYQRLYPRERFRDGHPFLANSLNNLGFVLQVMGEHAKALHYYEQALAMAHSLVPKERIKDGHPLLANTLNNLGTVLQEMGELAKALPYLEQALAMYQRLIPKERVKEGHPLLAHSLRNLGGVLHEMGEPAKALPYFEQALAMYQRLYPGERFKDGHPSLGSSLNNLGGALHALGEPAKALPYFEQALAMYQRLYPSERFRNGHPRLANILRNLGGTLEALGEPAKALPYYEQALTMFQRQGAEFARTASEAQALNHAASLPWAKDSYLSLTRRERGHDAYPLVWQARGNLGRVYERRHLAALAASDVKARTRFAEVVQLRRQRERLLLATASADAKGRDAKLAEIDRQIEEGDRDLLRLVPELASDEQVARATPADLRKALPPGAVFLDLLRYVSFEGKIGTKEEKRIPSYVAFLVRPDRVERAELGPATPIEEAITLWRKAISEGGADERHARALRRLVWEPIAKHLPAGTRTVYLAPDMALTALPWAALPSGKDEKVLLEEYDLCLVPHGPWLLGRLTAPRGRAAGTPSLLAVGGVAYDRARSGSTGRADLRSPPTKGNAPWGPLAGTAMEVAQIGKLATSHDVRVLSGDTADADAVLAALPGRRYAHLAMHGFFADPSVRSVLQLDEKLFARRESALGVGTLERIGAGARSPMVLSGLVCSGANRDDTPGRGIVTGDAISLLDLRPMHLAVLSACETGLGETAGGEGVFGLQRAFHIGGCRNVVASLWKVEDLTTAALMNRFYTYLWHSEKAMTPREALRKAQLDVYHNPDLIKAWASERGLGKKAIAVPSKPGAKTSPTRAWAAWVLSGPGD